MVLLLFAWFSIASVLRVNTRETMASQGSESVSGRKLIPIPLAAQTFFALDSASRWIVSYQRVAGALARPSGRAPVCITAEPLPDGRASAPLFNAATQR